MKKLLVALAAGSMVLGGCVSAGNQSIKNETNETIGSKLKEGMTMTEVRQNLGDPFSTSYTDGGNSIWNYEFTDAQMTAQSFIPVVSMFSSGTKGKKKQLVILFDADDKVQKFNMSDSDYETKSGIIPQ